MKFGSVIVSEAKGSILAHSFTLSDGRRLRKGLLVDDAIIKSLTKSGIQTITVAMPADSDVLEDAAATLIAKQLSADNVRIDEASTGRVNIFASCNGVFRVSSETINAMNAIDPAITIATLPDYACVNEGRLIATIKIIPYAVSGKCLEAVLALQLSGAISLHAYTPKRIGLISTTLPALKPSVMDKTTKNLERRLLLTDSSIVEKVRVEHDTQSIADAIGKLSPKCDLLIIFGASAISDIADCIPQAITQAGGEIIRFGMPVDPGNLMLLAKLGAMPIVGAPGCARSIAENGFDWVLHRLLADIEVTSQDIAGMGVGGLLMETGSRPHPREEQTKLTNVTAGIILAAGQSRRMGALNKMTVEVHNKPMVRHVAEAALGSQVEAIFVITGHKRNEVKQALAGLEVNRHYNPDYKDGLSTSLACGIKALPSDFMNALVLLGDMPFITAEMIDRLIEKASQNPDHIIVATHEGKRGNPVLWPRRFFEELTTIQGDVGARHIMAANHDRVVEVELGKAASLDLDTPEAVQQVDSSG